MADDGGLESTPVIGRRVTRQSTRRVSAVDTEKENPYRKPTYQPHGNGESSNDSSKSNTSSSHTPTGRGRGRGRLATPAGVATPPQPTSTPRGRGRGGSRGGGSTRGSATKRPGRPECIAPSSSGRKRKKKRKSYYNTTDYHYGSDFEEEEEEELPEEDDEEELEEDPPSPSASSLEDDLDMDLDDSSSSGLPLSSAPEPIYVPPAIPTENLNLPKSSEDLLIDKDLVIRALAVYEPLRRFSNLVRLTQFRFEEFCGSLSSTEEQNVLLVEIHIQLLKSLLREDDSLSTTFGPPELKDSIQSLFYFIDPMTWHEPLRMYLESDSSFEAPEIPAEYPFVSAEKRLDVLTLLVNQFLATTPVRDSLSTEVIKHEDHCRSCARLGELICCETCPAVYHLECIETALKKDWDSGNPPDQWKCGICKKDELTGTADCISELESAGLLIRQEKLGYDRHGRKFWFMARRIVVESETECWYYTTRKQLNELIYCLKGESYEVDLLNAIENNREEIERQMEVTEELTRVAAAHRRTWLEIEDIAIDRLNEERVAIVEQEKAERERELKEEADKLAKIEEDKQRAEEEKRRKEEDERRRVREERLAKRNEEKARMMEEGELAAINDMIRDQELAEAAEREREAAEAAQKKADEEAAAAQKEKEEKESQEREAEIKAENGIEASGSAAEGAEGKSPKKETDETSSAPDTPTRKPSTKSTLTSLIAQESDRTTRLKSHPPFKLGQAPIAYTNLYSSDPLALSKHQHQEERDRKRYTSHKFSLTTASDFKWFGSVHGNRDQLQQTLRATLLTLEAMLPTTLLHVNWSFLRRTWMLNKEFKRMMLELVDCLRQCLFNPVWLDQAGHLHLKRVSAIEREEKKKWEKIDKKRSEDEEERFRYMGVVNYTLPIKHQVFKQKGEEYRIHGQYGWIWHSKLRPKPATGTSSKLVPLSAGPQKHVIQVKADNGVVKTMLIEPTVYNKLMAKRGPSECGETPGIRYDHVRLADGRVVPYGKHTRAKVENVDKIVGEVMAYLLDNIEESEDMKPSTGELATATAHSESAWGIPHRTNTTPIDVSRGLVLANRVQFPKIAHGAPVCDGLLGRRLRAGAAEEKELLRKYGATNIRSCYSYSCKARTGAGACYSPSCTPGKVALCKQIREEKHYTTGDTSLKISLKKAVLPPKGPSNQVGTTKTVRVSSTYATSQGRSVFVLARWELRKLARSGGRVWTPPGFSSVKTWGPYPCGRPNFKTAWFWRTVTGQGLGAMALQLRILWACIRWDDLQAKPPLEGKSQVTTDSEIITYEILGHRIVGRFMERVQYLRKKHIMPIDAAPSVKTIVVKDTSPNTPTSSRHGLRKRKRLQSPSSPNPSILEEWVDEDKLELWEIRYYGERKQTRAKSGLAPTRPDKYDPSPTNTPPAREAPPGGTKRILDHAAVAEVLDNKVQHISKRNHAKQDKDARPETRDTIPAPKEPTASELLQQSIAARAFCTPEGAKAAAKTVAGRKFFVSKARETAAAQAQAGATPVPATSVPPDDPAHTTNINLTSAATGQTTRLTVFKGEDGRLQIKGLLPGQHCYQTADGRLHIVGSPHPQPSRIPLPGDQQKLVPVPMMTGTPPGTNPSSAAVTPSMGTPRPLTAVGTPVSQAQTPRLVSIASAGGQPRLVSVTPNSVPRLLNPGAAGQPRQVTVSVPGLQQQQRLLVTNAAGQQQVILAGGQPLMIRAQSPVQGQPQQQQQQLLPISIVSPSKQQPQQQQFRVVVGADGTQYFQQTPSPAATSTAGGQMIVRRQIQLPSGQIVQVQTTAPQQQQPVFATKSPAGTSAAAVTTGAPASTTAIPHPATLSLQRPPLVVRMPNQNLPPPPALVQPSTASGMAQQQQRPLILRRFVRPVTQQQLAELQMRGLVHVAPQVTTMVSGTGAPSTLVPMTMTMAGAPTASTQLAAAMKAETLTLTSTPPSTPKPVVPPVRMDTPPPVIIGLEKPVSMDNKSPVTATKSPASVRSPAQPPAKLTPTPPPLPPPPAIIGLDMKITDTTPEKPKTEPVKTTPPKITLPPLPPPPEIPLPPPSAVTTPQTPAAAAAKKVSRRKAVHTPSPYVDSKPPTPAVGQQAQQQRSTGTGLSQELRAMLFTHKENLKEDIMMKRALLEARLQRQILEKAALKPATPPKAQADRAPKYTCSCGRPITDGQFYVGCGGGCTRFFHGSCVGITKQDLNQGRVYTCDNCKDTEELEIATPLPVKRGRGRKKGWSAAAAATAKAAANTSNSSNKSTNEDKKLYCLCKQPYDDSHFYIGCDKCDDWFHGRCVGVLPVEGNTLANYVCPKCAPDTPFNRSNFKKLTPADHESLRRFIQQVLELREADDFYDSVDPIQHPAYRIAIREPMELKTMEQRVATHRYTRLAEFVADACRIFDNCRHYNQANTPITKKATTLETFFLQKLRILRQKLLADAE